MNNPFPYSLDNKRYYTWDYYSKSIFGCKVYKVPIDANFYCPNKESGGCVYCLSGSNAFPQINDSNLIEQFNKRKEIFEHKWQGLPYAYFQSYSNTYADLDTLKKVYQPFINNNDVKGIVIATRCDCLDDEKINYLDSLTTIKPIWIELGLQSIHAQTLKEMNRGHDYLSFKEIIFKLSKTNLKISVHLINGWPSETKEMMIKTAIEVAKLPLHAIKFHMLHILKGTQLGAQYEKEPFKLLTKEEYVEIVSQQLTYLPKEMIIERLTGDGLKDVLIAPEWTFKKVSVINDIDKYMANNDLYQGLNYKKV